MPVPEGLEWMDVGGEKGRRPSPVAAVELINADLKGFHIAEMTEVFRVDRDGERVHSVGLYKTEPLAYGFVEIQEEAEMSFFRVSRVIVLTDGVTGFILGEAIGVIDEEMIRTSIRNTALAKLTKIERSVLGLPD